MSTMSPAASRPARAARATAFVRTIGRLAQLIVSWWRHRDAIKALRELDDRALRDIGLRRCLIEPAAKGELDRELGRLR